MMKSHRACPYEPVGSVYRCVWMLIFQNKSIKTGSRSGVTRTVASVGFAGLQTAGRYVEWKITEAGQISQNSKVLTAPQFSPLASSPSHGTDSTVSVYPLWSMSGFILPLQGATPHHNAAKLLCSKTRYKRKDSNFFFFLTCRPVVPWTSHPCSNRY